jgi:hypothetical protein
VVELPATSDLDRVRRLLGVEGHLAFVPLGTDQAETGDAIDPARPVLFDGTELDAASVGADQTGLRVIDFQLKPRGAQLFEAYAREHVGAYFAIALDGTVLTAPRINSAIPGGDVEITAVGGWDATEAADLVAILVGGELPVPIRETSVDPSPLPSASDAAARTTATPIELPSINPTPSPTYSVACDPPTNVEGELSCADGVRRVLDALPPDAPVAAVAFVHDCKDVFIGSSDCFVQAFGQVTVTFRDGTQLTIEVSEGTDDARLVSRLDATSVPEIDPVPAAQDLVCGFDETTASYVFHVDRTTGAVSAMSPSGTTVPVRFGTRYSWIADPVGLILAAPVRIGSPTIVIADGRVSVVGNRQLTNRLRSCLAADGSVIALSIPATR